MGIVWGVGLVELSVTLVALIVATSVLQHSMPSQVSAQSLGMIEVPLAVTYCLLGRRNVSNLFSSAICRTEVIGKGDPAYGLSESSHENSC